MKRVDDLLKNGGDETIDRMSIPISSKGSKRTTSAGKRLVGF